MTSRSQRAMPRTRPATRSLPTHSGAARSTPQEAIPFSDLTAMNREVRTEIDAAVAAVLDSGRFIGGAAVEQFEEQWAAYCRRAHAVGVANGTDALHLTLRALDIGPGDEVVVPTNTFVASAEAVVLSGAVPRFADVDPDTLLLTPATLEAAITTRTRAVIVVHLYGQPADVDALTPVAEAAGLAVIEDAAQAHGASLGDRPAGSLGHAGCFSFYPGKNLGAVGDAGAVVTDDGELARRIRSLRDHGRSTGSHHAHENIGTNSRMDALQAVVLSAKLPRLAGWTAARRALAEQYRRELAGGPARLVGEVPGAQHAYHLMVARVPERDSLRRRLAAVGIETGLHYPVPCHLQPPYRRYGGGPLRVAERATRELLSLPLFPHMSPGQITRVCELLQELAEGTGTVVA